MQVGETLILPSSTCASTHTHTCAHTLCNRDHLEAVFCLCYLWSDHDPSHLLSSYYEQGTQGLKIQALPFWVYRQVNTQEDNVVSAKRETESPKGAGIIGGWPDSRDFHQQRDVRTNFRETGGVQAAQAECVTWGEKVGGQRQEDLMRMRRWLLVWVQDAGSPQGFYT